MPKKTVSKKTPDNHYHKKKIVGITARTSKQFSADDIDYVFSYVDPLIDALDEPLKATEYNLINDDEVEITFVGRMSLETFKEVFYEEGIETEHDVELIVSTIDPI